MSHQFAGYEGERDETALYFSPFLNSEVTCAGFQIDGSVPVLYEVRNSSLSAGAISSVIVFKSLGVIPFGPQASSGVEPEQ